MTLASNHVSKNRRYLAEESLAEFNPNGLYGGRRSTNDAASSALPQRRRLFPGQSVASRRSRFTTKTPPASSNSRKTMRTNNMVHVVCSVSENLARETCIASIDAASPVAIALHKQSNCQSYSETIACLELLQPHEILLNQSRQSSPLARKILDRYPTKGNNNNDNTTTVSFISRMHFDQTKGAEMIRQLARPESVPATFFQEFVILSAAHAVLHHVQQHLGANLSKHTLTVHGNVNQNQVLNMDRATILQLELLVNAASSGCKESLVGTINKTKTTIGSRLLRTNIMAPPTNIDTINARLELVDLLLQNQELFYDILDHLEGLPDVDKMLTHLALVPKQNQEPTARVASSGIGALLAIKSILSAMPGLVTTLKAKINQIDGIPESSQESPDDPPGDDSQEKSPNNQGYQDDATIATHRNSLWIAMGGRDNSDAATATEFQSHRLLRAILFAINRPQLTQLLDTVTKALSPNTSWSRNAHSMQHQECFALEADDHSMLSILRKSFLGNVDAIYSKADEYAQIHDIRVQVKYTTSRGYFLATPHDVDLPPEFCSATTVGRHIYCTTSEISSLNARSQENVRDILLMTYNKIQEILAMGRQHYDCLASLSDAIALLDLCHGFADHVALSQEKWSRPIVFDSENADRERYSENSTALGDDGTSECAIRITSGRYAIEVTNVGTYIANDILVPRDKQFTVISGVNGSGKSTLLKQIAICTVLAHCGSYVPAESAFIPIRDMLACRIGSLDDQEHNISTFLLEMKEVAHICQHATKKSLILLDELGRATSNQDGVAIAWSIAEHLIQKKSLTFFVTHYTELCRLPYPCVQNIHLQAELGDEITYFHKIQMGSCPVCTDYGVKLAASCGWPREVYNSAQTLQAQVQAALPAYSLQDNAISTQALDALMQLQGYLKDLSVNESIQTHAQARYYLEQLYTQFVHNPQLDLRSDMLLLVDSSPPGSTAANTSDTTSSSEASTSCMSSTLQGAESSISEDQSLEDVH